MGRAYAIDVGASALKADEVEASGGKVKILKAAFVPRELPDPEQRPETPATGLEAAPAALTAFTGAGVVAFPTDSVSMRFLASPTADPAKVANLVKAMAGEKLKDAEDQPVVTAHAVLPRVSTSKDDLILMTLAATDAFVQEQAGVLESIGVTAKEIGTQAVGLYGLAKAAGAIREETNAVLVDIGADWMQVVLVSAGEILFARTLLGGSRRITQALAKRQGDGYASAERFKVERAELKPMSKDMEKAELTVNSALRESADSLAGLLTQTLNLAKKEIQSPKYNPDAVILTGGGSNLKGLGDHLAKKLSKEVKLLDLSGLSMESLDGESQELVKAGFFSTALGMAIGKAGDDPLALGLTSLAVQKKRQFQEVTVWALAAVPVFVVALLLLWWQAGAQVQAHAGAEADWKKLDGELAKKQTDIDSSRAALKKVIDLRGAYVNKDLWGRRFENLLALLHQDGEHFGEDKPFQILEMRPRAVPTGGAGLMTNENRDDQYTIDILLQYDEAKPCFSATNGPQQAMSSLCKMIEQADPAFHTSQMLPEKSGQDAKQRLFKWRLSVAMSQLPDDQLKAAAAAAAPAPAAPAAAPGTTPAAPAAPAVPAAPATPSGPGGRAGAVPR
ncbi:MAG TPA: pilus assembly protein PilM [Planctomycetota bacterium]|nr:pilus assembly protein PilM [Planctomycetota bacterium]